MLCELTVSACVHGTGKEEQMSSFKNTRYTNFSFLHLCDSLINDIRLKLHFVTGHGLPVILIISFIGLSIVY